MSAVRDIQAAILKLSHEELHELRQWFEEYMEDHLELSAGAKNKLDESRRQIAMGNYTSRPEK